MTKKQRGGYSDGASYVMENYCTGDQQYARVFDMNAAPNPFGNEIVKLTAPPATVQALVKGGRRRTRRHKKRAHKKSAHKKSEDRQFRTAVHERHGEKGCKTLAWRLQGTGRHDAGNGAAPGNAS